MSAFVTASKIQNPHIKPQGGCLVGSQWYCVVPTLYVGTNTVTAVNDSTASEQFVH